MTRALERRISRLEALLGFAECVCGDALECLVVEECGETAAEIESNIEAQIAPHLFQCPIHGEQGPALVVQIRSLVSPAGADPVDDAVDA